MADQEVEGGLSPLSVKVYETGTEPDYVETQVFFLVEWNIVLCCSYLDTVYYILKIHEWQY